MADDTQGTSPVLDPRYTNGDGTTLPSEEIARIEQIWKTQSFDPMKVVHTHWDGPPKVRELPF